MTPLWPGLLCVALLTLSRASQAQRSEANFNHLKHEKVFTTCTTCHAGAALAGASLWPGAESCAACHDGAIQKRVTWRPPAEPPRTNVRFVHVSHDSAARARAAAGGLGAPPRAPPQCVACHTALDAPRMAVRLAIAERCLDCHVAQAPHLAAPDSACATCHMPLAQATRLTGQDVADFQAPSSHDPPSFVEARGHGAQAKARRPVAESCATCHARDFCIQCHVDAPEQPTIQALGIDRRSLAIAARLDAPQSHGHPDFLRGHGALARSAMQTCATCHTRESCLTCHATLPKSASVLARAAAARGAGAPVVRRRPASHGDSFVRRHPAPANTMPQTCAGCHIRSDCLECHRPDPARAAGYHPSGFLARHPASAYAREASCSDCHNSGGFCSSCHLSAGLTARSQLRGGYHDGRQFFLAGHGGAARQSLESCVSCHAERDCLTCHSASGGRRFSPHGPGFDPERLRKKNPQMCTACHGATIPRR